MARVIAVGNTKGGVGKSTLAVNLAVEATLAGRSVLLVDADPQRSAALFAAVRAEEEVAPLSYIEKTTPTLHRDLPHLAAPYDLAIIDVGGRDAPVFRSALAAADTIVIPMVPSAFDTWASEDVFAVVDELAATRDDLETYVVLNQLTRTVVAREAYEALETSLAQRNVRLLQTRIPTRTAWPRATGEGLAVTEWEPEGGAADDLRRLCRELAIYNHEATEEVPA